jgi:hypothetical protein
MTLAATDLAKTIGWIVLVYLVGLMVWAGGLVAERRKRRKH